MAATDIKTLMLEHTGKPPRAEKRMRKVQLIDAAHESQVGLRDRLGLVVPARSAQAEQFTLAHDRHLTVRIDQRVALDRPNRPSAPTKKSRSMVRLAHLGLQITNAALGILRRRIGVLEDLAGALKQLLAPGADLVGVHTVA